MNPLFLAASGAASQLGGLESTASNLANLGVAGFRRLLNIEESVQGNGSPYQYAANTATPQIDMSQGPLQGTNNPRDIAITGPAFLMVQTPDGTAYTRNGELQVSSDGTLLAAGNPVLSDNGSPISIPAGPMTIGGDGSINVNGNLVAKLGLADPAGVSMVPMGASLYRPAGNETLPPATTSQIHQGFLEHSTGSEVSEMVSMMSAMRNYESAMTTVHSIDSSQDQAIQAFTINA